MYRNIIFDMGGVLLDFSEARVMGHYCGRLSEEEQGLVYEAIFGSGLWRRMDRGDFDEAGMVREVCALLPEELHAPVRHMIPNYFETMLPLPANELIPLLKARGQNIFLLTNAPHAFRREKHRLPHLDLFDGVFASCDVGLLKPEAEIYRLFLRAFDLKARECLFIDDTRANTEGAAKVGIKGHCFADRDLEGLRKVLEL